MSMIAFEPVPSARPGMTPGRPVIVDTQKMVAANIWTAAAR